MFCVAGYEADPSLRRRAQQQRVALSRVSRHGAGADGKQLPKLADLYLNKKNRHSFSKTALVYTKMVRTRT